MAPARGLHVSHAAPVRAAASIVYSLIADYHAGHPRIVPPKHFKNLKVVKGGHAAGTEITFDMAAFGQVTAMHGVITEPEPGRVLVESYPATGVVTTFRVEPSGDAACVVTISTDFPPKGGLAGFVERLLSPSFLRKLYAEEIGRIDRVARGEPV
jgi:hypothetical protein